MLKHYIDFQLGFFKYAQSSTLLRFSYTMPKLKFQWLHPVEFRLEQEVLVLKSLEPI